MLFFKLFSGPNPCEPPEHQRSVYCTVTDCTVKLAVLHNLSCPQSGSGLGILQLCKIHSAQSYITEVVRPLHWMSAVLDTVRDEESDVIFIFAFQARLINWSTLQTIFDKQWKWLTLNFWDGSRAWLCWFVVNGKTFPGENLAIWHFSKEINGRYQLYLLPLRHQYEISRADTFKLPHPRHKPMWSYQKFGSSRQLKTLQDTDR